MKPYHEATQTVKTEQHKLVGFVEDLEQIAYDLKQAARMNEDSISDWEPARARFEALVLGSYTLLNGVHAHLGSLRNRIMAEEGVRR